MSTLKKAVLVPIDFTEESYTPLRQAYRITDLMDGRIVLLHVLPELGFFSKLFTDEEEDKMHKAAHNKLEEVAEMVEKEAGLDTEIIVAKGKVADKIVEVAEQLEAALICMGTHTNLTMKEKLVGSNAIQVVKTAKCPVETVRIGKHKDFVKNIILPLDLSKETKEKVKVALDIARIREREGVVIKVVSVMKSNDEFIVNKLKRQLRQVEDYIKDHGVACTATMVEDHDSSISEAILRFAYQEQGDLLVIMTQQETDFTDMFIGASAQYIIDKSEIPVLSVIPAKTKSNSVFTPYY
jgi:nucleotide-binding universal stress UspA family protein